MNKKTLIIGFSIILVLTISIVFSGIAEAVKSPQAQMPQSNIQQKTIPNLTTKFNSLAHVSPVKLDPIPVMQGVPPSTVCPTDKVQHWNKIIFFLESSNQNVVYAHNTLPDLHVGSGKVYEIIVKGKTDQVNDMQQIVADRLNELGYKRNAVFPIESVNINFQEVEHSLICAES